MGTHAETPAAPSGSRRLKPYQLSIAIGSFMAVFIAVSGVLPLITGWKNDSPIHREVFGGIPGPLKLAFYTVIPVLVLWGSLRFADRIRNWERGAPDRRRTTAANAKRRLADFRAGVYMRTLLRDSAAGLMHSLIYFGFLVLLGVTTVLELDHLYEQLNQDLHILFLNFFFLFSLKLRNIYSDCRCYYLLLYKVIFLFIFAFSTIAFLRRE